MTIIGYKIRGGGEVISEGNKTISEGKFFIKKLIFK